MSKSNAIKKLHQQGQSQREIAAALNVDRKTVRHHLASQELGDQVVEQAKGTTAPTGSGAQRDAQVETRAPGRSVAKSASQCDPYREAIEAKLEQGLHAKRIFQDLQLEHDFSGSYWSVRRFVKAANLAYTTLAYSVAAASACRERFRANRLKSNIR